MTVIFCDNCMTLFDDEVAPNGKCPYCEGKEN